MTFAIDGVIFPLFNKMSIGRDDAIATNRGMNGAFNADRSFAKDKYTFVYELLDMEFYQIIKAMYEDQFATGKFYRVQVSDTEYPIDAYVYIEPASVQPKWSGQVVADYTLTLIQA